MGPCGKGPRADATYGVHGAICVMGDLCGKAVMVRMRLTMEEPVDRLVGEKKYMEQISKKLLLRPM